MTKKIDFSKTIYELVQQYPELVEIMASLGFTEIRKKVMLRSVGKLITIPKGAVMRGINMIDVITTLQEHGFEITGTPPAFIKGAAHKAMSASNGQPTVAYDHAQADKTHRIDQIKAYLHRLSEGEDLESVRADFVENFSHVEAAEIMQAEQELMREGTPLKEVQRLCDVHSALFHGATREEKIANAEKEVEASVRRQQPFLSADAARGYDHAHEPQWVEKAHDNMDRASALAHTEGHPLQTFYHENEAVTELIHQAQEHQAKGEDIGDAVAIIRGIAIHYAKKGDLLYPHLKVKYDISGPSQVMWTIDDEIRNELGKLCRQEQHDEHWNQRAKDVLTRALEMTYKENNILFPLCAANFTEEEWMQVYKDGKDYSACLNVVPGTWEAAEQQATTAPQQQQDKVTMPGGALTIEQLTAMLNTLPMEITFVDADNINRYFNEGHKLFKRPQMALGREVFSCHPPKIEPMVRAIIDDFRSGKRSQLPVWMEKEGRSMLVNYMAVRDAAGHYLGTVEVVQDMEFAKQHFLGK